MIDGIGLLELSVSGNQGLIVVVACVGTLGDLLIDITGWCLPQILHLIELGHR
jgi:hypothetical protein